MYNMINSINLEVFSMAEEKDFFEKKSEIISSSPKERKLGEPTGAFKGATWAALLLGIIAYTVGLFNAGMELNEKGYYLIVLLFGLYAAVSLQKAVRDRDEGMNVTNIYMGLSW